MERGTLLNTEQINEFLTTSVREHAQVVLSFTRQGKWHLYDTGIDDFDNSAIALQK